MIPRWCHQGVSCGIRPPFESLSPALGQITHVLRTRSPLYSPLAGLSRTTCMYEARRQRSFWARIKLSVKKSLLNWTLVSYCLFRDCSSNQYWSSFASRSVKSTGPSCASYSVFKELYFLFCIEFSGRKKACRNSRQTSNIPILAWKSSQKSNIFKKSYVQCFAFSAHSFYNWVINLIVAPAPVKRFFSSILDSPELLLRYRDIHLII